MSIAPEHREWFTPVWAVPLLLVVLVAIYAVTVGPTPDTAPAAPSVAAP